MKQHFVNSCIGLINKYYDYDSVKIEEIKYGLASVYITLTKTVVILASGYFLGIFKEMIILLAFYNILRLTGFGLHAKKSSQCWVSSLIIFIALPFIARYLVINYVLKIVLMSVCVILIFIYAPADTEKKPIINKTRRLTYKIVCTLCAIMFLILIITINNNIFTNCLLFGAMIETVLILPLTYKIFKLKYANYKTYKKI